MDVYWQSIVHGMDKLSDEKLEELSRDSENAHRALVQGIGAIGSLMVTAGDSDDFGDNEAKAHLAPIGDLLMQLSRYSQALFENAGNAEFELKQREQKSAVAKKTK
ncbi:hypothetical protein [Serratia fonticola]|uniref:hypothetical protein n=1 Tax=Serratia fonticola TaxID=47917 RepID=UPI0027F85E36|nr:hypothetical protein [Serratia fonticola]MDQ7209424.1 hypothetical protein [Serratia fonticola]HBE9082233.1 hypothetical protein [Serratia fonticola]HBE9092723.1 hypothetical protein [Serratia fonticola]